MKYFTIFFLLFGLPSSAAKDVKCYFCAWDAHTDVCEDIGITTCKDSGCAIKWALNGTVARKVSY
jgi:hypothetical protein